MQGQIKKAYNSSGNILALTDLDNIDVVEESGKNILELEDTVKLPYTELEYIESTGTQYIQSGFTMGNGFIVEVEYMYITRVNTYYDAVFGSEATNYTSIYFRKYYDDNILEVAGAALGTTGIVNSTKYKMKTVFTKSDMTLYNNDAFVTKYSRNYSFGPYELYIFSNSKDRCTCVNSIFSYKVVFYKNVGRKWCTKKGLYPSINE